MIMLDSVIRLNKRYYPQTLLDDCKYEFDNESDNDESND